MPIILLGASLLAGTLLGFKPSHVEPLHGPVLRVDFMDVGQGDCILIQTPDGESALVDAGEEEYGPWVVEHLRRRGVRKLALVIMTHPHSDHIGGMPAVLTAFSVGGALDSGYVQGSETQERVFEMIRDGRIPYYRAKAGIILRLGAKVRLEVLSPPAKLFHGTKSDANNNSVVFRLVFGRVRMLFTGDIDNDAVGGLISSHRDLESQVLKVPHHGANDSTPLELLRLVRPDYAVICSGAGNDYGHPQKLTLRRLSEERTGAATFRTDTDGTISMSSDGGRIVVEKER